MTEFQEADARLGAMHGYEPARPIRVRTVCEHGSPWCAACAAAWRDEGAVVGWAVAASAGMWPDA